ncbi:MAG: type I secretion system permease/ATPase [Sphingorhabdus sp.]
MDYLTRKLPAPLADAIKECKSYFISSAAFSALVNILFLAPTLYMMQVYDRVVPTGGIATLFWLTILLGLALAVLTKLDGTRSRLMIRASLRLNDILAGKIFDRILSRDNLRGNSAVTGQAMRDFDTIRQAMVGPGAMALFDAPWTPLYLLVAFMLHPVLGLLIVAGGAVLVALAFMNERSVRDGLGQSHQATARAYAAQDMISSQSEIVRVLGMRRAMINRQLLERNEGLRLAALAQLKATGSNSTVKFIRMLLQSLALGAAAWLAVGGHISSGAIIAGSVLLSRALQPIEQLVGAWPQLVQARQSMKNLAEMFEKADPAAQQKMILPNPEGHLHLSGIALRNADHSAFILRGISFNAEPGEIVGILGASGSGKSTLARIASGAIAPDVGEVRIDGAEYESWDPDQLARHIGYLPQDCGLLPGSILENISRFSAEVGDTAEVVAERAVKAAKLAGIHDLILQLPEGYGTRVGENGYRLSGGQAQRVTLARALFGDPELLILDEPNSALDAAGEQALARTLEAARLQKQTILLISHKPQLLGLADRLIVLSEGTVSIQGPRDEIIAALQKAADQSNVVEMKQA